MTYILDDREMSILIDNVSDKVINNRTVQTQKFIKKLNRDVKNMRHYSEEYRLLFIILVFNGSNNNLNE